MLMHIVAYHTHGYLGSDGVDYSWMSKIVALPLAHEAGDTTVGVTRELWRIAAPYPCSH